jgi:hypothetical protein
VSEEPAASVLRVVEYYISFVHVYLCPFQETNQILYTQRYGMCIENVPKNKNVEIEGEDMTVYIHLAHGH